MSWQAFEQWRGRPVDLWTTWNNSPKWGDIDAIPTTRQYNEPRFPGVMSFAQPLFDESSSMGECARGAYDGHFVKAASALKQSGWGRSYIRLGWEMNGSWYRWSAAADPEGYKACFRRAAEAFRSVSSDYVIEWSVAVGVSTVPAIPFYPGDDWVDVVGVDYYDTYPAAVDEQAWAKNCGTNDAVNPRGLCDFAKMAREHGKKLAVPEWGVDSKNGNGGFDNPFFVHKMMDFFCLNRDLLAYEAYFDLMDERFEISSGHNPRAAEAYRSRVREGGCVPGVRPGA